MQQRHGAIAPGPERQAFLSAQPTYWLKRCYQALRRSVDAELRRYGLTLSQRDVLLTLWDEGPLDQRSLRDRLGLEQSSVSRLVDGLVRRGWVRVEADAADRRVRLASLTPEGRALLQHTPGASELAGEMMVAGLTDEERGELLRLLQHCAHNLMSP
jgi:DNA-binding MarR family transcriptional regulator